MEWKYWLPIYEDILKEFHFSREEDERATLLLSKLLDDKGGMPPDALGDIIHGKPVIVTASAFEPQQISDIGDGVLIATGDSMGWLLEENRVPDIIVTDLDGDIMVQLELNRKGSIAVIHAHGDNIPAIEKWVPRFTGRVIGTTQSTPLSNVHNFGGFTDGDRAVFLADHFGAKEIRLLGFDFENPVPKAGIDIEIKKRKLKWAKQLLEEVKTPILFN